MQRIVGLTLVAVAGFACGHTRPATYVELLEQGGAPLYVAGAAGSGLNQSLACNMAVGRAVTALAEKFADNDDLEEEVAEALDVDDAKAFLFRYARDAALGAAVQDVQFDPVEHLCMATIRWQPPAFPKEAVLKLAEQIRRAEAGGPPPTNAPAAAVSSPAPVPASPSAPATPPPPAVSVAPPAPAAPSVPPPAPGSVVAGSPATTAPPPAMPAPPACVEARRALEKALAEARGTTDKLAECLRRTGNDEQVCVRYKMQVGEAATKQEGRGRALASCLNGGLGATLRAAVEAALPGHAARPIETRPDGNLLLWTVSPVASTAYALEIGPDGREIAKAPLAANQVQWLRQQLGL